MDCFEELITRSLPKSSPAAAYSSVDATATFRYSNPSICLVNSMSDDPRFDALKSAPLDSWIALSEDETAVVAVGSTYDEAVKKSESAGVSDPVLVKTPKAWHSIAV